MRAALRKSRAVIHVPTRRYSSGVGQLEEVEMECILATQEEVWKVGVEPESSLTALSLTARGI